jgi:hypothetical protein
MLEQKVTKLTKGESWVACKAWTVRLQGLSRLSGAINREITSLPKFRRQLVFGCRDRENGVFVRAKPGKMSHNIG